MQQSEANLTQLAIEQNKPSDSKASTNINTNETRLDDPSKSSIRSRKSGNILTQLMSRSRRKKFENYSETKVQLLNYKINNEEDKDIHQAKHASYTSLPATGSIQGTEQPQKIKSKSRIPVPKQSYDSTKEKTQAKQDIVKQSEEQITQEDLKAENKNSVQSTTSARSTDNKNKVIIQTNFQKV